MSGVPKKKPREDRQWGDYVEDIGDAVQSIDEFIRGMTYDEFVADKKTTFAVLRGLEIIGEAAKNIPAPVRNRYQEIPWKDMAGIRDKVIHFYFGVDFRVIWKTITEDIPMLKPLIDEILNDLQ